MKDSNDINAMRRKEKNMKRRQRLIASKRQEKRLREKIEYGRYPGTGYFEHGWVDGKWVPVGDHVKHYSNSRRTRYYKRVANRKVRRTKDRYTGGEYKKVFEYWWKVV